MHASKLVVASLVAFALLGATAAHAGTEKGDMRIQFGALYSTPTDDLTDGSQTSELSSELGFQASFEYMVTGLIGIEPALAMTTHDVDVTDSAAPDLTLGEIDVFNLNANLNFHLLRESKLDLFLGPTLGYAFWGDLETEVFGIEFPADDEFIYGLNLGLDVPFGQSSWSFTGALNYLLSEMSLEGSSGAALGVDPLQVKVGVSYRF